MVSMHFLNPAKHIDAFSTDAFGTPITHKTNSAIFKYSVNTWIKQLMFVL